MENCSLALHIPEYGSEAMEITRVGSAIDVWSLAVVDKVDLQTLSYRTLPRRIDKVGSFTPRYNATEQLPSFACESGTYYAFLLACPRGARKDDCWVDVTSTKQKSIGAWVHLSLEYMQPHGYYTRTLLGAGADDLNQLEDDSTEARAAAESRYYRVCQN